jgi:hypothetical protein
LEYKGDDVYVKFGTPLTVEAEDDKLQKINELTDTLATLKWEIWELFPVEHRADFSGNEWEEERQKRIVEYPKLDVEYPEGARNGTENLPVMELFQGTARMAMEANVRIVPVAIEQYDKRFIINFGNELFPRDFCKCTELTQKFYIGER